MDLATQLAGSPVDVIAAMVLYGVHLSSMACWIACSAWTLVKQRDLRAEYGTSKTVAITRPTQGEYFGVRLLALFVLFDALRAVDLCFDSTDGVCRAVWGFVPWWIRSTAWVLRDVALLSAIGSTLNFHLGWTYAALEWEPPRSLQRAMHGTLILVLCAVAASFWALMTSNRQSWQAIVALFVVVLNIVWAWTNCVMLKHVLPAIEKRLQAGEMLPAWTHAAVGQVRLTAKLVLTADVAILVLFPLMVFERIVLRNAHHKAFYPSASLGDWIGSAVPPLLTQRPDGTVLNPALEIVELLIGWLQFVYVLNVGRAHSSTRVPWLPKPDDGESAPCSYIDEGTMGDLFRSSSGHFVGEKKGQ